MMKKITDKIKGAKATDKIVSGSQTAAKKIKKTTTQTIVPLGKKGGEVVSKKVVPALAKGATKAPAKIKEEITKIHQKESFWKRISTTLVGQSIGLLLGMLAADIVSEFFDTRRAGNLWGLFSQKRIVSDEVYAVGVFAVEFLVVLLVFTIVDYYFDAWRESRKQNIRSYK